MQLFFNFSKPAAFSPLDPITSILFSGCIRWDRKHNYSGEISLLFAMPFHCLWSCTDFFSFLWVFIPLFFFKSALRLQIQSWFWFLTLLKPWNPLKPFNSSMKLMKLSSRICSYLTPPKLARCFLIGKGLFRPLSTCCSFYGWNYSLQLD